MSINPESSGICGPPHKHTLLTKATTNGDPNAEQKQKKLEEVQKKGTTMALTKKKPTKKVAPAKPVLRHPLKEWGKSKQVHSTYIHRIYVNLCICYKKYEVHVRQEKMSRINSTAKKYYKRSIPRVSWFQAHTSAVSFSLLLGYPPSYTPP